MIYDDKYALERIKLLKVAQMNDLKTVRFGTMKQLANLMPWHNFVVVYTRPLIVTEIQWAYQDYQSCLGAEFIGNVGGPNTCMKSLFAGEMNWTGVYKNPKGWKMERQHLVMKWRGENKKPILDYPIFMVENVNGKIVRVATRGFGVRSLGIEGATNLDFKSLERELREKALTKRKEYGKILNIVKDNSKNTTQAL